MRLNKLNGGKKKKSSSQGWTKIGDGGLGKPKYVSLEITVGRVSSDVIATVFAPQIKERAAERLEKYADDMVIYGDLLKAYEEEANAGIATTESPEVEGDDESTAEEEEESPQVEEMETEVDRTVRRVSENNEPPPDIGPPPEAPPKPLFHSQYMIDELLGTMTEISNHFSEKGGWKVHARAAKFERDLDEKYGIFRPFVTNHPEIEVFVRSMQRKYEMGGFSPLRTGPPPIPKTTSIIILFMMQRNGVRWDAMILSALFLLVGLQPWALVTIVAVFQQLFIRRARKPVGTMPMVVESVAPYWRASNNNDNDKSEESEKKAKLDLLLKAVGKELGKDEKIDGSPYDTILIGSGPDTLYTGALLARAGRKILVLSPGSDASGCLTLEGASAKFKDVPFDAESSNISRISRQQELLAPALCTYADYQGGVRFAQVGSEDDGYAFEILSIPGMGADDPEGHIPFVLRSAGGSRAIMDDTASLLGDGWPSTDGSVGGSTSGVYMAACASINASAGAFYLSKILPETSKGLQGQTNYEESSCRYAEAFLNKCFPLNPHLRSLMAGIGMKGENIKPNNTSMGAHVTNICAATGGEGMFYPVGGPRSLCHALATSIEQRGGRIITTVPIKELLFEETTAPANTAATGDQPGETVPPRCVGVKLFDGQDIKLPALAGEEVGETKTAVINMKGFIDTFVRLLPENIRTAHKVPMGLPALAERRPLFKILFALKGSTDELNVTGADYYRLPAAARARDQIDSQTGAITLGEIGRSDEPTPTQGETTDESSEAVPKESINADPADASEKKSEDAGQGGVRGKRSKTPSQTKVSSRSKFDAGVSWLKISFPSAKDPSWEERHGKVTTCVVTIEADDDFVVHYDTKPKLFSIVPGKVNDSGNRGRLIERVKRDLTELYPQLDGKVEGEALLGPFSAGLSHNPERYAAKGIRADTPYPGLYVGGSDLTVGDSFSGAIVGAWLAANAVMGYKTLDLLFLEKNITSDLERFMDPPGIPADPDTEVAVPFKPRKVPDVAELAEDENASAEESES